MLMIRSVSFNKKDIGLKTNLGHFINIYILYCLNVEVSQRRLITIYVVIKRCITGGLGP